MKETRTVPSFGESNTRSWLRRRSRRVGRFATFLRWIGSAGVTAVGLPFPDVGVNRQTWTTALRGQRAAMSVSDAQVYLNHLVD